MELTAYELSRNDWTIEPAPTRRDWMDQSFHGAANRCLPLVMANQMGWIIRCPVRFNAVWNPDLPGGKALTLTFDTPGYQDQIVSRFGSGIVSFVLPWLFRTSDGYGLMVRGPTNHFRPDASPLDGLVETDWAPYTFTMNWKVMAARQEVWFEKGAPICMLIPYPMGLLDSTDPHFAPLASNPVLVQDFKEFATRRMQQGKRVLNAGDKPNFRLDYLRGRKPDGQRAPEHRSSLNVRPFGASATGTSGDPASGPAAGAV